MKLNTLKIITIVFVLSYLIIPKTIAADDEISGIGLRIIKDHGNSRYDKTFVMTSIEGSPATVIPTGSEILEVNGQKVKNLTLEQISNLIRGESGTTVNIKVKKPDKKKEVYTLTRKTFKYSPKKIDKKFEMHWNQVGPANIGYWEEIPYVVLKQLSYNYASLIQYWVGRRIMFRNGYNACLSYPDKDQNVCLINLVNREIAKTSSDKSNEIQANMVRQQAVSNYINTMNQIQINNNLNRINNTLRGW